MSKSLKNILITGSVLLLLVLGYFYVFNGGDSREDALLVRTEGESAEFEREILTLLLDLRSVDLDGSFLGSPLFESFQDFSLELRDQPTGRVNPFAPIGTDAVFPEEEVPADVVPENGTTTTE